MSQEEAESRRRRRSFGRLPRPQPLPDRAPHRQRRLRHRLRGLGRPPRAARSRSRRSSRAARRASGCCARPRRRRGSTTPASSPSTRWARRTATRCWSPSWSRARPWPGSAATATLSDREIGEIGADLCEALDHAHSRGVVHRDIKPQNVLVTDEGEPRAKLMDFGVARLADARRPDRARRRRRHPRLHVPRAGRGPRRRARGRRLLAGPDAVRVLERREPEPPRHPRRDRAGDRRPRRARCAASVPTCPASSATRSTPACSPRPARRPAAGGAGRARSRTRSTASPSDLPAASAPLGLRLGAVAAAAMLGAWLAAGHGVLLP